MAIEDKIQADCFQWAWNTYPNTRKLLFHVPNGGSRNKVEAMKLKAMGVIPGVPDLFLLWHGVFHVFECKTETGKLSNDQKELHALWAYHSTHVTVFRSLEEFKPLFEAIVTAATPATSSL